MRTLLLYSFIFLVVFLVWSSLASLETSPSKAALHHQCKPVTNGSCAHYFNMRDEDSWYARFPNARGLGLTRSLKEFYDFSWLLNQSNYCSRMLHIMLCFYYFPPCSPLWNPEMSARPCREVCREATEACQPIARALRGSAVSIPRHLDCANFEESRGAGNGEVDSTELLACPNSSEFLVFTLFVNKHL